MKSTWTYIGGASLAALTTATILALWVFHGPHGRAAAFRNLSTLIVFYNSVLLGIGVSLGFAFLATCRHVAVSRKRLVPVSFPTRLGIVLTPCALAALAYLARVI